MALQFVGELLAQREVAFLHGLTDDPQVDWPLIWRTDRETSEAVTSSLLLVVSQPVCAAEPLCLSFTPSEGREVRNKT